MITAVLFLETRSRSTPVRPTLLLMSTVFSLQTDSSQH